MMSMDIAALAATPASPDAAPPSPAALDGASGFAALLDEAAQADAAGAPAWTEAGDAPDEEENIDDLAALAMTSLLSLPSPEAPEDPAAGDAVAGNVEIEEAVSSQSSCEADGLDETRQAVLAFRGSESAAVPEEWQAQPADTAPAGEPAPDTEVVETEARVSIADASRTEAGETSRPEITGTLPAKPTQASTSSLAETPRGEAAAVTHGGTSSQTVETPAAQTESAERAAPGETRADGAEQVHAHRPDPAPASAAQRLARALARAAASTPASGEAASAAAVPAAAQTPSGAGEGSDQPSFFAGDDPVGRNLQSLAAHRRASGVLPFTVAAPESIDVRTLAQQIETARLPFAPAEADIPERDVVAQLVQSMRVQFRDGIGQAVVRLRPEHLGAVQIALKIENGSISATVQAEVASVRQWLESQQDTLRASLAEQGLRLERFVVEPDGRRQAARDDAQPREERRRQHRRQVSGTDHPVFEVTA